MCVQYGIFFILLKYMQIDAIIDVKDIIYMHFFMDVIYLYICSGVICLGDIWNILLLLSGLLYNLKIN